MYTGPINDILSVLPARNGHFLLESGYHSDLWLNLDGLFIESDRLAPLIDALAEKLRPHDVSAVCGPLLGGAFLAQALARALGLKFLYAEPGPVADGLFKAQYRLPPEVARQANGERVALVDDAISAGSSVRGTQSALEAAGASIAVVGAFMTLGDNGLAYFAAQGIAVEALDRRAFSMWKPDDCPLCRRGEPLVDPRER